MEEFLVEFRKNGTIHKEYIKAPNQIAANNAAYTNFGAITILNIVPAPQGRLFSSENMKRAISKYSLDI
jgi:hypothetical protein